MCYMKDTLSTNLKLYKVDARVITPNKGSQNMTQNTHEAGRSPQGHAIYLFQAASQSLVLKNNSY